MLGFMQETFSKSTRDNKETQDKSRHISVAAVAQEQLSSNGYNRSTSE
jgi:hypothetical protein